MENLLFVKPFIFSLILLFSGCEIPHTNSDGDVALCNIYDEVKSEIILCPQIGDINLKIGKIPLNISIKLWFLSGEYQEAVELQNSILEIENMFFTENGTSFIKFTPIIVGTTILTISQNIHLEFEIIDSIF